jgi:hypothetical protein
MGNDPAKAKDPIYVDFSLPATLSYYDRTVNFATLDEVMSSWHKLPNGVEKNATIKVDVGSANLYDGSQIAPVPNAPIS